MIDTIITLMLGIWLGACGAVAGVATLCWIALKDEYALRIEWYRKAREATE